jgi:hypothetical protein
MSKKQKVDLEFCQRLAMIIASGIAVRRKKQVRAATEAICREPDVALPADWKD